MNPSPNVVVQRRRSLAKLTGVTTDDEFHDYLIGDALDRYVAACRAAGRPLGSALAICANVREAAAFARYPFSEVVLSGILPESEAMTTALAACPQMRYERQNGEASTHHSQSFDLVFCKEGLHHLARPLLGLYEMLRIARKGVIVIEPFDTHAGRLFEKLGIASVYEHDQDNIAYRDNYVYRFARRQFEALLSSYYIDSGYSLELTLGWLSTRMVLRRGPLLRRLLLLAGWLLSFVPGSPGNYMTAFIQPGTDLPPDPISFSAPASRC